MNTKLTLTIEKAIIEKAKAYAKTTGRSLSDLIERYLESITDSHSEEKLSPKLKRIVGKVKLPPKFDEKKELDALLKEKYL